MKKYFDTINQKPKSKQKVQITSYHLPKKTGFFLRHFATISIFIFGITLTINPFPFLDSRAEVSINHNNGIFTDDFADNSGLSNYHGYAGANPTMPSSTFAKVDATSGSLKLTNDGGTFVAPYQAMGYVFTQTIMPQSVSRWGTFSYVANKPVGTTIRIQVTDDYNGAFTDEQLPGNTAGFTASSIDLRELAVLSVSKGVNPYSNNEKVARLKFKIILETIDPNITPTIDAISFNWSPKSSSLPATSTLNDSGWSTGNFNNKSTKHTNYQSMKYPVVRWKSNEFNKNSMFTNMKSMRLYNDLLIGQTWVEDNHTYWINRNTGETIRELDMNSPLRGNNSIDQNGIMYNTEILSDITTAIDLNTGEIKWTYAFGGGHGNNQAMIGPDGTIYTIYQTSLVCNTACVSHTSTLYAFNPNGSIKYTKDYTLVDEYQYASELSIQDDGTLFFGTSTQDVDGKLTNNGKLYAIDPSDGSVLWNYSTGDISSGAPIIDNNGDIYVYQNMFDSPTAPKKMYSIDNTGALNWERSIDASYRGWSDVSLSDNGQLTAIKINSDYSQGPHYLEIISAVDGSIVKEVETNYSSSLFTDGINNSSLLSSTTQEGKSVKTINNYSDNLDMNWQVFGLPSSTNGDIGTSYGFSNLIQDEKSWLYSGFTKTVYNSQTMEHTYDQEYAAFFALAPWTLVSTVRDTGNLKVGNILTFDVTTSMQQTNPLTGGGNQLQVVFSDGTKVPMIYNQTNSNGDTAWIASTTITPAMLGKINSYTIEANADSVTTDVPVNFDNPKSNTNNTGYKISSTFIIDNQAPVFTNLEGTNSPLNVVNGQIITTNPYILRVKPTDNVGVDKVEFYIDDKLICTKLVADSNGVYSCSWDTSKHHSDVKIIGYDVNGNTSQITANTTVDPSLYVNILPETGKNNVKGKFSSWLKNLF